MTMPFTPCDPSQPSCDDASISILSHIFGPIIEVLARGVDPNTIDASSNLLASIFAYYNTGVLAVASLIISYVATVGTVNTANDGEAMGKQWSAVWTPLRIVTGGAVLLPTASGYSFLQMFVLTLSLWGVGFANQLYKVGMTMGIIKTDHIVSSSTAVPPSAFGLRDFAKRYLPISYCAHAANAIYADQMGTPAVRTNPQADRINAVDGRVEYTFFVKDRNLSTNLAGGDPICGTIKLSAYTPQGSTDATGTSASIAVLHAGLSEAKTQAAIALISDINAWVATMPTDITKSGWTIESKKFNEIIKQREDALVLRITEQVSDRTADINSGISTFVSELTKDGWAMAGGWYQRAGAIRKQLGSAITESVGNASEPSLSALPGDARAQLLRTSVFTISEGIIKKSEEPGNGYDVSASPTADITNSMPKTVNSDVNVGAIQQDIQSKFGSFVNTTMKKTVDIATGSSTDVDAVSRMKLVGDSLVVAMTSAEIAGAALKSSVAAVRAAVAAAGGIQVLGTKVDGSGSMTALWDWVLVAPLKQLDKMISYIEPLAFYFSVFLPSLPYSIFMITIAGWLLGVLQTVIAAPLWAVMHMRPSQTFVGSDAQGYLLLLALFVRPALAVIGLFAAMLLADPIVDYIAKAFFSMRGAVVTSTGLFPGALVEFVTFAWWLFAFGITLLPVLYMIYGLPQVLPDHVLKWINAGVHDLGATHAMSNVRGGLAMTLLQAKDPGKGGGKSGGSSPRPLSPIGPTGGGSGAPRHAPINAGEQGVAPLNHGKAAISSTATMHHSSASDLTNNGEQGVAPRSSGKAATPTIATSTFSSAPISIGEPGMIPLNLGNASISSTTATTATMGGAPISSPPINVGDATIPSMGADIRDEPISTAPMNLSSTTVSPIAANFGNAAIPSTPMNTGNAAIQTTAELLESSWETIRQSREILKNSPLEPPSMDEG